MLGSANTVDSVNSKIIGAVNRIDSNTNELLFLSQFLGLLHPGIEFVSLETLALLCARALSFPVHFYREFK